MSSSQRVGLAGGIELLGGEMTHRVEHREAAITDDLGDGDERRVHQAGK